MGPCWNLNLHEIKAIRFEDDTKDLSSLDLRCHVPLMIFLNEKERVSAVNITAFCNVRVVQIITDHIVLISIRPLW